MSGIYAVLYSLTSNSAWAAHLDRLIKQSKQRGDDGQGTRILHESGKFYLPSGGKLYHPTEGGREVDYNGVIGCAYSQPISLDRADAGPFVTDSGLYALAYDGIVTGHTGESLLSWFNGLHKKSWTEQAAKLEGQFAILSMTHADPGYIYYAVRAKPLYLLVDSMARGIVIASAKNAFEGLYHPTRNPQPIALEPYTSGKISLDGIVSSTKMRTKTGRGSVILSGGGLDSLVAAYDTRIKYPDEAMTLLHFRYGCKAEPQEIYANGSIVRGLQRLPGNEAVVQIILDADILRIISRSTLTGIGEISHKPVAGRPSEWVPVRNTVFLSLALAYAETYGQARIITGINQDAATAYPDNDEEWLTRMRTVVPFAVGPDAQISLEAPLARMSKVDIVKHGAKLRIPWSEVTSWSCYEGGKLHCGTCSSCRARRKAFSQRGSQVDPTEYA
jgi:7-cyano-7-deazaguanine synthase